MRVFARIFYLYLNLKYSSIKSVFAQYRFHDKVFSHPVGGTARCRVQTNIASCVLGRPKCFRRPKTTYRYPTLQSRVEIVRLIIRYYLMWK